MTEKILTMDRPNPRQQEFLRCRKKYVAFGGARGGGKSWAVRAKAKLLALRYPGIRLLLVRRTYQELEANHIRFLRQELAGLAEYRATARQFVFPNGSVLDFGYCAADGDMDRYQGAEYDVIFLDEATQLKEEWLRQFAACLRGVNEHAGDPLAVVPVPHVQTPEAQNAPVSELQLRVRRRIGGAALALAHAGGIHLQIQPGGGPPGPELPPVLPDVQTSLRLGI